MGAAISLSIPTSKRLMQNSIGDHLLRLPSQRCWEGLPAEMSMEREYPTSSSAPAAAQEGDTGRAFEPVWLSFLLTHSLLKNRLAFLSQSTKIGPLGSKQLID